MMKKITGGRIAVAAGIGIFAVATWFVVKTPAAPALPASITTTTMPSAIVAAAPRGETVIANTTTSTTAHITIVSPTSGTEWVTGNQNTITWSRAAGVTGQLYLVNAATGIVAGWIQQNIGPNQTYFPWNTRSLFLNETNPNQKDVMPGEYFIKLSFVARNVPSVISAPFYIIQ